MTGVYIIHVVNYRAEDRAAAHGHAETPGFLIAWVVEPGVMCMFGML